MARYEDYIKEESDRHEPVRDEQGRFTKTDSLIDEIEEAAQQQETREEKPSEIPDRFSGKSPEEIAQSYVELEKLNSRQAQDLGDMRKQVDHLLELQTSLASKPESTPEQEPVTMEELYDDPDKAISRIVRKATKTDKDKVEDLEQQIAQARYERAFTQFENAHPDWKDIGESSEFRSWVLDSPYRQRLAGAADVGDLTAADDLLSMYKDVHVKADQNAQEDERKSALNAAALESTDNSGTVDTTETFSRKKLLELQIASKRGDDTARQWLADNDTRIQQAYLDHRVVD